MDTKPTSQYVTLKIEPSAREAASRLAYALTGAASKRISQSEAIRIGSQVALNHLDECIALITAAGQPSESAPTLPPEEDEGEER